MTAEPAKPVEVFYSYAHEDSALRDKLKKQLASLKRKGLISEWYDRDISAGDSADEEIIKHLNAARVILLLISPDFIDSDYCNDVEVARAMERHNEGSAKVIPVILRPTKWQGLSFSNLQVLPSDARPVTLWRNQDEAFLDVANSIETAIKKLDPADVSPANASTSHLSPNSYIERPPAIGFVNRNDRDGNDIVKRLRRELVPGKNRLVALWGAGGSGKTALAAEVARLLVGDYQNRVIWISADGRDEFALSNLLDEISNQLHRSEEVRRLSIEQKKEAVQRLVLMAPTLIVFDNFETVKRKEQTQCLDWLSRLTPNSLLITTRANIEFPHILNVPVEPMLASEANEFLDRLLRQHQYVFEGIDRQRIIEAAEANPLILQWVVAQIALAQDWREVLDELAKGEGDAAHRVFDRSFRLSLLNNGGRAALLALSLFVPSASRSALAEAASLAGEKNKKRFKDAIRHLAALWLVRSIEGGTRLTIEGLTRDLARARLASDPRGNSIRQRFVTRFTNFVQHNSLVTVSDLNALETERENILAAIDVACSIKSWESAIYTYLNLRSFLDIRGYWDELISRGEKVSAAAIETKDKQSLNSIAEAIANTRAARGEYAEAEEIYHSVLNAFRELKSDLHIACTLYNLGSLAQTIGEIEQARQYYEESLNIDEKINDEVGKAHNLNALGTLELDKGSLTEARRLFDKSLEIREKLDNKREIAVTRLNLSILEDLEGNVDRARELCIESLEIDKKLRDQKNIASSLHQLGWIEYRQGKVEEARQLYKESLEIYTRLGYQIGISNNLHDFAALEIKEGQLESAETLLNQSVAILRKLKARTLPASLETLGGVKAAQNSFGEARSLYTEALNTATALGDDSRIASVKESMALLEEDEKNRRRDMNLLRATLGVFKRLVSPRAKR